MSRSTKVIRSKSGGSLKPLCGTMHHSQGTASPGKASRNHPSLLINQLQTLRPSLSPTPHKQLLEEKEKEFKSVCNSYLCLQQELKDMKKRLRKTEARELKLRDQIAALEKLIAELRIELKKKAQEISGLNKILDDKIKHFEEQLAEKDAKCVQLSKCLKSSEADVDAKQKHIKSLMEEYEEKIKQLKKEHEGKIKMIEKEKEDELQKRDDKLQILKERMAETIGKNSNERQQQLEELKKDLIKTSQEAKNLHKQLNYIQTNPPKCSNCAILAAQLDEKSLQVRLKDKTINDLQNIGKSMQLQLHQQDTILTKWEEREKSESQF